MNTDWKKQLRQEASLHHMCEENRTALEKTESREDAIKLYKKTIDWALENGYPDLETIRWHFGDCDRFGIYVDKEFHGDVLCDQEVYVFHNCKGEIKTGLNVSKAIIPMLYFANGCDMTISHIGPRGLRTLVPLYDFGENKITALDTKDICFKHFKDGR